MEGADILGIVALAIGGGAGAYVAWYVSRNGMAVFSGWLARPARSGAPWTGSAGAPLAQDPLLVARIDALREEVAGIAATQARMLQGQAEREGMLLAEMRAVASLMDPKIVESLARIETSVGITVPPPGAGAADAEQPDTAPAPSAVTDRLHVVHEGREDIPLPQDAAAKTIRRG